MLLTCPKDLLLEKLQTVLKTVATKSSMPVLSGIRVETKSNEAVELASTDMELSLRLTMRAGVGKEGAAVVPGRLLTDIVRSLPVGEVKLEFNGKNQVMEITSSTASFRVNCLPAGDFPKLPEMPQEAFEINAEPLVETINTVARAASRDDTRPVLTGILAKFGKDRLKMVATDSYRLSVKESEVESTLTDRKEVIVPRASLEELARLCGQEEKMEKVSIGVVDGQIMFGAGDLLLSSRLIEGQFPNYQQLLPDEFKYEIGIDREELLEVVSRIGLMAQKNAPLRLKFTEGELVVSAQTPQVGEAKESLPVPYRGEEVEIGFNPEYMRDGIESVDEDKAVIRIISPLRPGLIKGADDNFLYLIMPVRLTG